MHDIDISKIQSKYNLSPIETIMFAFDISRVIKYNCYEVFKDMLNTVGINCFLYRLYGNKIVHSRCVIHIKDTKHDIDGVYFLDLGWSLKNDLDDHNYKYIYNYFAKPKSYFDKIDQDLGLADYYIGDFVNNIDSFYDIALFDNYNELDGLLIEQINNLSEIIDGKSLNLPEKDYSGDLYDIYETLNKYDLLLEKPISGEKYLEILFNVSKVKYLENISDDFDLEYFKKVFFNSDWKFETNSIYDNFRKTNYVDDNDRLLADIYGLENIDTIFKTINYYSEKNNLEERIYKEKIKKINLF